MKLQTLQDQMLATVFHSAQKEYSYHILWDGIIAIVFTKIDGLKPHL